MTPACLMLDAAGVDFGQHRYDHDPASSSFGEEAAVALGVDPRCVYKTLMASLETGELVVAVVPVTGTLDLKALAVACGSKKASMATVDAAERSSGFVAGGISPFGQRTQRRTILDRSAVTKPQIYVSGGRRGFDVSLDPHDLVTVLDAKVAPIGR